MRKLNKRRSLLERMGLRCSGGCFSNDAQPTEDTELIDMKKEEGEYLHISDYTAHDSNLIPVLQDDIEYRRVQDFHDRNLTIVDQSPIALRKFEDLTKELSTVIEPISIVLPQKLPFDLNSYHPCMDSQAPTLSDDEDVGW